MTRRGLLLSVAAAAVTMAFPAAARDVESELAARLRREGFSIVSRKRTLLGRVRVLAAKGKLQREVVFDPTSGEILRDYVNDAGDIRVASREGGGTGTASSGTDGAGSGGTRSRRPITSSRMRPPSKAATTSGRAAAMVKVAESTSAAVAFDDSRLSRTREALRDIGARIEVAEKLVATTSSMPDQIQLDEVDTQNVREEVAKYFAEHPASEDIVKLD